MTTRRTSSIAGALGTTIALSAMLAGCGGDAPLQGPTAPTANPGRQTGAPISTGPIAFVSTRDGSPHIYVANADGSAPTRLTSGDSPAWSRDGRIAFQRSGQIFTMNADGSNVRGVGPGASPDWSPDGTRLVFATRGGTGGIIVMNADGSGRTQLIGSEFLQQGDGVLTPVWSPDGQRIAFVRANWEEPRQIYVMNADGSQPRRLINGSIPSQSNPAWSPDGSTIIFESPFGIATVNANGSDWSGSGWNMLNMKISRVFDPDWTADGRGFIFNTFTSSVGDSTSSFGSRMRVFVAGLDGNAERQLIPEAEAPALSNHWDDQAVWARVNR